MAEHRVPRRGRGDRRRPLRPTPWRVEIEVIHIDFSLIHPLGYISPDELLSIRGGRNRHGAIPMLLGLRGQWDRRVVEGEHPYGVLRSKHVRRSMLAEPNEP